MSLIPSEKLPANSQHDATLNDAPSVTWDDPRERRNPKNWPLYLRIFHTTIPCMISFLVTFSTSVTVPAAGIIAKEFSITRTEALLPLTLYTLGLAFGPLFIAPFSEVWGRRMIYISTLSCLLTFTGAGAGAPNFTALLAFRFLAGFLGSSGMAIGAGTVSDLWNLQKTGGTVGLPFILGPFLGPILGPVAGTYILARHNDDWRWTQWLILLIGGPVLLASLFMKETSKTYILRLHVVHTDALKTSHAVATVFKKVKFALLRSVKMLFTDIIVFSLTIYTAYAYALTFSYLASIPYVFPRYYSFNRKETSLVFISVMIGYFLAIMLFAIFDRTLYARARRAVNGGMPAQEHRLYAGMVGSICMPVGLFWYAWAGHEGGHWAVQAASGLPFGLGAFTLMLSTVTYLVDVYQAGAAASALAANGSIRFTLGAVFPLFTVQMYERLGIRWAGSVFAFLSVAFLPIPWLLYRYGHILRAKSITRA